MYSDWLDEIYNYCIVLRCFIVSIILFFLNGILRDIPPPLTDTLDPPRKFKLACPVKQLKVISPNLKNGLDTSSLYIPVKQTFYDGLQEQRYVLEHCYREF